MPCLHLKRLENGSKLQKIPVLEGPGKDVKILPTKVSGRASFEAERLFGLPEHEFVGDYIRAIRRAGARGFSLRPWMLFSPEKSWSSSPGREASARQCWPRKRPGGWPGAIRAASSGGALPNWRRLGLEEMLNAFDNVFGLEFRTLPLDAKRDQVLGYLRNYDTASLLVVDNAESIQDQNLWRFLEGIPQPSAALVTTRESLPCGGREIRVPEMETEEAGRLLISRSAPALAQVGRALEPG